MSDSAETERRSDGNVVAEEISAAFVTEAAGDDSYMTSAVVVETKTTREDRPDPEEMPLPTDARTVLLAGLFVLGALAVLYAAAEIILPVVIAIVLKLLLQPLVRGLERVHVPRGIGAALSVVLLLFVLGTTISAITGPAASWAAKLPDALPQVADKLAFLQRPIGTIQSMVSQLQAITGSGGISIPQAPPARSANLVGVLFSGTATVAAGMFTTLLVLFYLLVSGETFLRRLVEILPILGAMVGIVIFLMASVLSLGVSWWALLPVGLYFGIHVIEGEFVTPMLMARRFTINPVAVILALVFWYWMWGVPGAILAVPMLAITKILCDDVRPLRALGHFLEG